MLNGINEYQTIVFNKSEIVTDLRKSNHQENPGKSI